MPRKTRIYWITKPTDLNKCHSRRCEEQAMKDRLCSNHWTHWKLAGFQPPMPESYGGIVEPAEPPLQQELKKEAAEIDAVMNVIASRAVDEVGTLSQLDADVAVLEEERVKLKQRLEKELEPYEVAEKRTKRWFKPVEEKLDRAIELARQRREVTRSTVQNLDWNKQPKKTGKKKAG